MKIVDCIAINYDDGYKRRYYHQGGLGPTDLVCQFLVDYILDYRNDEEVMDEIEKVLDMAGYLVAGMRRKPNE